MWACVKIIPSQKKEQKSRDANVLPLDDDFTASHTLLEYHFLPFLGARSLVCALCLEISCHFLPNVYTRLPIFFHPVDNAHLTDPAVPLKLSDGSGDGLSFARRYRKLEQRGAAEGIEPPFSVCAESVFVGIVYVDVTNALVCVLLVEANAVIVARQICGHKLEAS